MKAIVDWCFLLENTADAHRYFESCEKRGAIIVAVGYVVRHADVSNWQIVASFLCAPLRMGNAPYCGVDLNRKEEFFYMPIRPNLTLRTKSINFTGNSSLRVQNLSLVTAPLA